MQLEQYFVWIQNKSTLQNHIMPHMPLNKYDSIIRDCNLYRIFRFWGFWGNKMEALDYKGAIKRRV